MITSTITIPTSPLKCPQTLSSRTGSMHKDIHYVKDHEYATECYEHLNTLTVPNKRISNLSAHISDNSSPSKSSSMFTSLSNTLARAQCTNLNLHLFSGKAGTRSSGDSSSLPSVEDFIDLRVAPDEGNSWTYKEISACACEDCHSDCSESEGDHLDDFEAPRIESPTVISDSESDEPSSPSYSSSTSSTRSSLSPSPTNMSPPPTKPKSLRSVLSHSPSRNRRAKPISFADEHGLSLSIVYEVDEEFCQYPIPKHFSLPCQFM